MAETKIPETTEAKETTTPAVQKNSLKIDPSDYKKKKPGIEKRLRDIFIADDATSVGDYILNKVIIPGTKKMLLDGLHGAVDSIFGGGRRNYSGSYSNYYEDRWSSSYRNSYDEYWDNERRYNDHHRKRNYGPATEFEFNSRGKAERARDILSMKFDSKGYITVDDFNDIFDIPYSERDSSDREWGWTDFSRIRIRPTYSGYVLEMPRPEKLD